MEIGPSVVSQPEMATPQTEKQRISSDFDTFLRMLTAQMKNQDPLNPVESADFATQLATFSGVEQAVMTNDLLRALSAQFAVGGLADMAGWVGKEARAAAPAVFDGAPITIFPTPVEGAEGGEIVIRDTNGREVERLPVVEIDEPITWAGNGPDGRRLASGIYDFTFVSLVEGRPIAATPAEVFGKITEVRLDQGQSQVVFASGRAVPADLITAIRSPSDRE